MIVRRGRDGTLLLISQSDHARLAAALISAWNTDSAVPAASRADVLFAIEQHDNGWREIDASPVLNPATRRPHDFVDTAADVKQGIWPRGVARVGADSPLAGALVAQHALTLHEHRRNDAEWRAFFSRLEDLREQMLGRWGGPRDSFERSYALLYLGDLMSLVFCNGWTEPAEAGGYRVTLDGGDGLVVSPDPFGGATVRFGVPARAIPDRQYASGDELRRAFADAAMIELAGSARGGG